MPLNRLTLSLLRLILAAEQGFATFSTLYFTSAFIDLYKGEYAILNRVGFYLPKLLVFISFCLIVVRWKKFISIAKEGKFIFLFVAITILSTLWSDAPSDTQQNALSLLETTLFGAYLATRFNFKEQTQIFTWVFAIATLFSIVYVFALPKYGITQTGPNAGFWRGIFVHKNTLGRIMTIGEMFFLSKAFSRSKYRWLAWLLVGISFQLILGTNSKTALVSFLFLTGISPFHRIFRWKLAISIALYLIVLLVGGTAVMFLAMNWEDALASINKTPDLNGRVPIWEIIIGKIQERPWLGYGFTSFWRGWESEGNALVWRSIFWHPKQSHNGFLDLVLALGLLGGVVFLIGFFTTLLRAVTRIRLSKTVEGIWPLGFLTFYVLLNQTQSDLVVPYSILWILYVTIGFSPIVKPEQTSRTDPFMVTRRSEKTPNKLLQRYLKSSARRSV